MLEDTGTINVIDNKETLSFKVTPPQIHRDERSMGLRTGINGFLNMVKVSDEEGFGLIRTSKIIYNGLELNSLQKIEFWNQIEERKDENN